MKDKRITATLTYAGRRVQAGTGVLRHLWLEDNGTEHYYGKLRGQVVGGIYTVEADEKFAVYPDTLKFTGASLDNDEWRAADKVAQTQTEMQRLERKYAKDDSFDKAMEPLRELYRAQRTYAQRSAFTAMVLASMAEARRS